jgi:hypothetical protein
MQTRPAKANAKGLTFKNGVLAAESTVRALGTLLFLRTKKS